MIRRSGWLRTALSALALTTLVASPADALEIKIASVAPDGSYWMRQMRAGGERIRELTDGRVEFKFYPGGIMGTDAQVLRKIRVGQLHGGAFTTGGLSAEYKALNVYGIPLMFRSLDEVDYVRERLDPQLAEGLEEAGWISLGFSEGGFATLMANAPVRHVNDLRRQKVWVQMTARYSSSTPSAGCCGRCTPGLFLNTGARRGATRLRSSTTCAHTRRAGTS
jgi:TRAP-type C4-dicarboxylate transport system substrate-binding protein